MIRQSIIDKLTKSLSPSMLEVINDSQSHAGHAAMKVNLIFLHQGITSTESHFIVKIISKEFAGKALVARHRLVYSILEEEMKTIHALNISAKTE
jgi:stress-induced morphogen